MSRSIKKHPVYTDGKAGRKRAKRQANKTVRKFKNKIKNGKDYKKLYCSWNIHDYISRYTWVEAKKEWEENSYLREKYATLKEFYKYWSKYYKRK